MEEEKNRKDPRNTYAAALSSAISRCYNEYSVNYVGRGHNQDWLLLAASRLLISFRPLARGMDVVLKRKQNGRAHM